MEPTKFKVNTTKGDLRVRKLPASDGELTGIIKKKGTIIVVTDQQNGWSKIAEGWVYSNFLLKVEETVSADKTVTANNTPPSVVKMKTLIIGAGHGGGDPGASGNRYIERDLAIEFRDLLVAELQKRSVRCIIDDNANALKASLVYFKKYFKPDSINIDIHWNAGPPAATGTEVLISTDASQFEKQLGGKIATTIATILGIKNRGLKTERDSARGTLAWLRQAGYDFIIEMCFISNKTDMDKYQSKKIELSKEIAKILFDAVKS